jgi:hypothetical protein
VLELLFYLKRLEDLFQFFSCLNLSPVAGKIAPKVPASA